LAAGASSRHDQAAVVFDTKRVVLATGRRSIPPLVPGSHVPGVLDAYAAMALSVDYGVAPGRAVVVVGTGERELVARRLRELGVNVILDRPVAGLRRINGRRGVESVVFETTVACDALVHAGPWRVDPGLLFQARAEGLTQLQLGGDADAVVEVAEPDASPEPLRVAEAGISSALVCPCMDVTAAEILALIGQGETDPELLKRLTSCGMGPCQGMPCWETLAALVAAKTGGDAAPVARPSHRPPRRTLTVAQAAGLCDLVEPDR
jgi:sarcosine oxidase subunit alpha